MIVMMFDYDFFWLGNAVMRMIETGVEGVQFAAINTGNSYDGGDGGYDCGDSYDGGYDFGDGGDCDYSYDDNDGGLR